MDKQDVELVVLSDDELDEVSSGFRCGASWGTGQNQLMVAFYTGIIQGVLDAHE